MVNVKKRKYINLIETLFVLYLTISILYVPSTTLEEANKTLPIVVPYIFDSNIEIVKYAFILIAFIVIFIEKRHLKLDGIAIALIYRLIIGSFQIFWVACILNKKVRFGNYFLWLLDLLIYIIAYNSYTSINAKKILCIIHVFSLIISLEVIVQALVGIFPYVQYSDIYYKACLNIPVGSSNYLSTLILPCLVASMVACDKKDYIWFCGTIIQVMGILLTKSRTGILFLAGISLLLFAKYFRNMKRWMVAVLPFFFFSMICVIIKYKSEIIKVFSGYSSVVSTGGWLNKLMSGRIDLVGDILDDVIKYPIFGYGPNYTYSRPHNIVIDLLYQSGVIGVVGFFYVIYRLLKKYAYMKCKNMTIRYTMAAVFIFVMNAFVEISILNSLVSDLIFFSLLSIWANEEKADSIQSRKNNS